jgi:hypothetical protein
MGEDFQSAEGGDSAGGIWEGVHGATVMVIYYGVEFTDMREYMAPFLAVRRRRLPNRANEGSVRLVRARPPVPSRQPTI